MNEMNKRTSQFELEINKSMKDQRKERNRKTKSNKFQLKLKKDKKLLEENQE